jgi:3-deoxy-D-manno-octulosonic-acid transferase
MSAVPLIQQLRSDQPKIPIYISSSTVAGRKAAERHAAALVDGIFYAPLDFVFCVREVLHAIRPAMLVILETEIWPNLYAETRRSGARIAIVNGRISNTAWPRYFSARTFFRPVLLLADLVAVQSQTDSERYAQLGVPAARLERLGNLKYDAALAQAGTELPTFGAQKIWVAASTAGPNERGSASRHAVDEDDIVIDVFRQLAGEFPKLLLVLAPRQPARFDLVADKLTCAGISFLRRTELGTRTGIPLPLPGVLLLDTIGELPAAYASADAVFVGGSLAPRGGHNILEPAAAGAPVIVGPHMQNFAAITHDFLLASAIIQVNDSGELLEAVRSLLRDPSHAHKLGRRARAVTLEQSGAARRIASRLWQVYYCAETKKPRTLVALAVLRALSLLWETGGRWKRAEGERINRLTPALPVPVVSIGGITIGGSGKTPFTRYLSEQLRARGRAPAILTRGYRRRSPAPNLIFAPGTRVAAAFTGDEAQIFLRAANAPVGIGADRYETAQILLSTFPETDILLLDDGFQHARLARNVDIVIIDGLDPFGGEELVPLGRLREPLEALQRADLFVVTRAENTPLFEAICSRLKEFNPSAPVFRTRLIPRRWREYDSGNTLTHLEGRRVAAFCGLGNPQNFWNTLDALGLNVVYRWAFPDHHAYTPIEIARLAHQARAHAGDLLVTTEKDRVNLPQSLENALKKMNLAWLEIDLELESEGAFFQALDRALETRHPLLSA